MDTASGLGKLPLHPWLLLSMPPACNVFAVVLSTNSEMECPDLFQCIRVCLPKINVASVMCVYLPQRCLSRTSTRNSSLLARASPDTLFCRCVCHGSAPFAGRGTQLGRRCRNAGSRGGGAAPATQRVHDRGGRKPRARYPFDRLVVEGQAHCPVKKLTGLYLASPCSSSRMMHE